MKIKRISFTVLIVVLLNMSMFSSDCAAQQKDSAIIKLSGYIDTYYAYYTDSVGTSNYQKFPSDNPRSNAFGLNHAMITAQYDGDKVRGIVSLCYGDIMRSAWSPIYNIIMEAHAGVRLSKKLWLDAGFFRTHTGAEGLLPKENFTTSVSVSTFYEPYYECGFRLDYHPTEKLMIDVYGLNGYNMYEDNNKKKSVGLLATYTFNDNANIGITNYTGDDTPTAADSLSHLRIFQNVFANYQYKKLKMQLGFDYFYQQNSDIHAIHKMATAYSGVLSFKYLFNTKYAAYTRGEIFNDPNGLVGGIIINRYGFPTGYKLWGNTTGVEYKPTSNTYIRIEGRLLQMNKYQEIFRWQHKNTSKRMEALLNFGISF